MEGEKKGEETKWKEKKLVDKEERSKVLGNRRARKKMREESETSWKRENSGKERR